MTRIQTRVGIKTSLSAAYEAVHRPEGLSGWWAAEAEGTADVGGALTLRFPGYPDHVWGIQELRPQEHVVLSMLSGPDAWKGSSLRFDLAEGTGQVWVTLTHTTAPDVPHDAYLYFCTKWPTFLVSLKAYLETGAGMPYPNDIKIQHDS